MKDLVRLGTRPSRDGKTFVYTLVYVDEEGKRVRSSLGHADKRKADRQRAQKERELRMGIVQPGSLKLSEFLEDSLSSTRCHVTESTLVQYEIAMERFIEVVGDIDIQKVSHRHGERYIQACYERKNGPATVNKNLRSLKRLFELAVLRGQLEQNPLRRVQNPKVPRKRIRVYSEQECAALIRAAKEFMNENTLLWDAIIIVALCTGMRRGELLNTVWSDIDFAAKAIHVSPKTDTAATWQWRIKDNERRVLPLTESVVSLLADIQASQSAGYPYVFLPNSRYDLIQQRRLAGNWTTRDGVCPANNFTRHFKAILKKAGISQGEFHDLRRTCMTQWITHGLSAYDVMQLAGHSDFDTTQRFYLATSTDLVQRARAVSLTDLNFGTHLARAT